MSIHQVNKIQDVALIEKGMKIYDNYKKGLNVAIFENDKKISKNLNQI